MSKVRENLGMVLGRVVRFCRCNCLLGLAVCIAFAVICLPFWSSRLYAGFDLRSMGIPSRIFYAICLEEGQSGFWMPFFQRGVDHVGFMETGIFHPSHFLLYRFLPLPWALCLEMILPFPICLLGAYLLLRKAYGLGRRPAFFGAALLAFSVFPLAHFGQVHVCLIFAHLPWLVLAVEQTLGGTRRYLWTGAFALLCGSMLLLCQPQIVLLTLVPAGCAVLRCWFRGGRRKAFFAKLGLLAVGGVAGLMIGMVQFGPTMSALRRSERGSLTAAQRNNFSLHPLHLVENLAPGVYGPDGLGDWVRQPGKPPVYKTNASEFSAYFGIAVLTLLWCSLTLCRQQSTSRPGRRRGIAVALIVGALIVLMLGGYTGLNSVLGKVPLISQLRAVNRYKLVLSALVCFAAALSLAQLRRRTCQSARPRLVVWCMLPAAVSMLIGLLAWFQGTLAFRAQEILLRPQVCIPWGVGFSAASAILFLLAIRGRTWAAPVLAVLCFTDVCIYALPKLRRVEYRSFAQVLSAREAMRPRPREYRVIANTNAPVWDGEYLTTGYLGMAPKSVLDLSRREHLQLASIGAAYPERGKRISVRPRYPRFRLVSELRQCSLTDLTPDQIPRLACIGTENPVDMDSLPLQAGEGIDVLFDGYDEIHLRTFTKAPRVLVCSDRWSPNWVATIDGHSTEVLPLFDGALRGVRVPAGSHELQFHYVPREVLAGSRWTLLGLLLVFVLWGIHVRQQRSAAKKEVVPSDSSRQPDSEPGSG